MDLFVYYDVPAARAHLVRERVRAMQSELGGDAQLMRRADGADPATWMEVYRGVDDAFAARLDARSAASGLAVLTGPRHVERFVDVA